MPTILTVTVIIVLVLVVATFLRDAKQAQQRHADHTEDPGSRGDVVSHHETPRPPDPEPPAATAEAAPVDTAELAKHVRGLRRAVDEGLIGHDEAVGSIVRQAGGGIGAEAAARLLAEEGGARADDGEDGHGDGRG